MVSSSQTRRVLITGANRGLGLALTTHYADRGWQVIATCRQSSLELDQLAQQSNVRVESLDVGDEASIAKISRQLHDVSIDVLINNAGIYGLTPAPLSEIKAEDFMRCMQVNALGPTASVSGPRGERESLRTARHHQHFQPSWQHRSQRLGSLVRLWGQQNFAESHHRAARGHAVREEHHGHSHAPWLGQHRNRRRQSTGQPGAKCQWNL